MKKSTLILTILFLFILSACNTDRSSDDQTLTQVTINNSAQINYAPIYFAQENGYFEDYGIALEVIQFDHVNDAVPLLMTGHLDVYAGSVTAGLLNTFGQNPQVKAVADRGQVTPDGCTFQAIVVRKDLYESGAVTSVADFKGLTIASSETASKGFQLSQYLQQGGLSFADVKIIDIPNPTYEDVLANKTLDAIVTPEIVLTRLLRDGNVVILSRLEDQVSPYQISVLAFGKKLIQDDPDLGVRFMAAYLKGVEQYNLGKTEQNLAILSERTGESLELLKEACWIPIRSDGIIDFKAVTPFQDWSVAMGHLDAPITEEQFWDPSFLARAKLLLNEED